MNVQPRKSYYSVLTRTIENFIKHDVITGAAAVSFYAALSLAPLILLFVSMTAFLGPSTQKGIISEFTSLVGSQGGEAISMIVKAANRKEEQSILAALISLAVLIFSASGVFAQLQSVLNLIFDVDPDKSSGIGQWLRKRLFSIGILFALGFTMVVSLIVSTLLSLFSFMGDGWVWEILNFAVSIGVFSLFFALVYKYLPDIAISWKDVWVAALLTSFLFSVGKYGIGLYLGNSAVGSAYGAAGSFIVLLLWVYYSSIIVFFGAELSASIASNFGSGFASPRVVKKEIKEATI